MKTFKLVSDITPQHIWDYDLYIGTDNQLHMVDSNEAIAQDVAVLLRTLLGEDIFHPNFGVDWLSVFEVPTDAVIESAITNALKDYPGLRRIISIEVTDRDYSARTMTINLTLDFTTGPIVITTSVGGG